MDTDEHISKVCENRVDDWGIGMCLNDKVVGSGFVKDGKFDVDHELHAINLVVDLSHCSTKKYDHNIVEESNVKKENDVEFTEKEGEFEFTDLVWGKVKNHPWWPGQIMNLSASTDEAMKHFKTDGFLVAYFGDQTFSFNELHDIKPFRMNFCKMGNQSNDEAFVCAVSHALREAARRVEFGLACLCLSEEVCGNIKSQVIVNSGIREESSRIDGGDRFSSVNSFKPAKTVDFLLDLAKDPFGINRLHVSTVRGQLSAFNRWKGYHQLQINQVLDAVDDKFDVINSAFHLKGKVNARGRPRKRKHLFGDGFSPTKKVKRLSELMSNDEFLSQVYLAARNPIEGWHNLDSLVKFASDFRNYRRREDKNDEETANQPEAVVTDALIGIKDSYWADMTIVTESDISTKPNKENSATSLTFKFTNLDSVPSVKKLHEIFRRYGALQENETRVLKKKKCVKLVFERKCDAETAFSSSGKFSIFGPALVSYRLNFSPKLRKTDTAGKRGAA
ncbi:hypothetical protein QVD17_36336 [Tagetes erecta]|uniref:PWWP domain-containing protein n=1 Tax=Tagetes erecta TaxID=13708 RepID=A0AAD8JSJ6_TARER|nr:hypothetical protein QVD17_36336 [Tagetes erecta]